MHPELEISLNLSDFSKEVCQLPDWQTYTKFVIIWNQCTNISGISPKNFRKISHPGQEISLCRPHFSKEVSQLKTDRQTKICNYLEKVYNYLRNVSKKFQKDISSRTRYNPLFIFDKDVSKQTDWQTYMKFRIICSYGTNIPGISPEKIRKISHPELEISLYLSNFSKEVSQLTD